MSIPSWLAFVSILAIGSAAFAAESGVEFIADMPDRIISAEQGWGELGINVCAHARDQKPLPIKIGETVYKHGLGHHAPAEMCIALDGEYQQFDATVGLQPLAGKSGSVVFQVFVDDQKKFDSGIMRAETAAKQVQIPLAGAKELRLVVTDGGNGFSYDCANWAESRLTCAPGVARAAPQLFDVAPFASIVGSDPTRVDGARATRVQEYRVEDVHLEWPLERPVGDCIGLSWFERRPIREVGIVFAPASTTPSTNGVQVQAWIGSTAWQGNWKTLQGEIEAKDHAWRFAIDSRRNADAGAGVRKIRWLIPKSQTDARIERLTAMSLTPTSTGNFLIETEPTQKGKLTLGIYNGQLSSSPPSRTIEIGSSEHLTIQYTKPRTWKGDRTLLRFVMPDGAGFSVAVDDVLAHGPVYVRDHGVFVSADPAKDTLADYKRKIVGRETILQQVRRLPDQTFANAMQKIHHAVQDRAPAMLSLACDNNKFTVARDGSIEFPAVPQKAAQMPHYPVQANLARMSVTLGGTPIEHAARRLDGGWLPAPVIRVEHGGMKYRQRTMVIPADQVPRDGPGWLSGKPLCVSEFELAEGSVELKFTADVEKNRPAAVRTTPDGVTVEAGGRMLAFIETLAQLHVETSGDAITLHANQPSTFRVLIPAWNAAPQELAKRHPDPLSTLRNYWEHILETAMQADVPDDLLMNVIRASQVHCLMAARNEDDGRRIAPWIASAHYGPLESEANSVIRGMDLFGHAEFAQRSFDFFIDKYDASGFLTTGYTLMGTGWHLQTLGQHYALAQDREWLSRVAPKVASVCEWIQKQRAKTMRGDNADRFPEYGLMPPGVMADWDAFAYYFCLNGYYCAGLREASAALNEIGYAGADQGLKDAEDFATQICRAFHYTQSLMPVYPLRDGTWAPGYPSQVHAPGPTNIFFPSEDINRSWCYDIELGSHHLVPQKVLDPASRDVDWMMNHMEDMQFLANGWFDYPAAENEKDPFDFGGFAKVQPYYCRNAEIHALRNDVKPFIRSYFNTLPSLLNAEVLSLQEHFHAMGAWNKTHETGYFLQQTRFMLVMEHGDTLWLAPLVTNNWLKDGMHVSARNAPTRFGPVNYRIASFADKGYIDATIDPPTRTPPKHLVIRLRDPQGRRIVRVTVNGKPHEDFSADQDSVRMSEVKETLNIRAYSQP